MKVIRCEANGCGAVLSRSEVRKSDEPFDPAEHYVCYDVGPGWKVSMVEKDGRGRLVVLCPLHGSGASRA